MIKIKPILKNFGADITGIDLNLISDESFDLVYKTWLEYGVLRFRGQKLDKDGLQRFSRRFGPLEEMPTGRLAPDLKQKLKNIYVTVISNIIENGKPIGGLGSSEANWHSDMTYVQTPPPASVLFAIEIPPTGGDTWFADPSAAYAALPTNLRDRVHKLSIKHDAAHTSVGRIRPGFESVNSPEQAPGAVHPIISTHPETSRKCLYLGRREWAYVMGLSLSESEALLDELWQFAALDNHVLKHQWNPGDLIIWDNRRVLHRRDGIDPNQRRLLHRCQVLHRDSSQLAGTTSDGP